jgi:predicted SAM-dependent methyltransferase
MRLHLGCGPRYIEGWTHMDLLPHPHVDLLGDAGDLRMLRSGSVEMILAVHLLEHFSTERVPHVLAEWRRVLQPHGVLRVSVPDFSVLARLYMNQAVSLPAIAGPVLGGQKNDHDAHLSIYDWDTLRAFLTLARFVDVKKYDPAETDHAHVDDYSRATLGGMAISLNVEASRP